MGVDPGGIEEERWKSNSKRSLGGCPPPTEETGAVETPGVTTVPILKQALRWLGSEKAKLFTGLGCLDQFLDQLAEHKEKMKVQNNAAMPMTVDDDYDYALIGDTWQDIEIEITLDSGCVEHVLDAGDAPGYCLLQSAGSKRRQNFVVGNGHKIPNKGEVHLNLEAEVLGRKNQLQTIFQVPAITRPLMSVSKICDQGLKCVFDKDKATVFNDKGDTVCEFQRRGGLYVTTMKLKRPVEEGISKTPFQRPER